MSSTTAAMVEARFEAPVEAVWSVLDDGWAYATWVVGASRIRGVDEHWPQQGTRLHHSFGVWPLLIDDNTEVLSAREPEELVLRARGWPLGEAQVKLALKPESPHSCTVSITEDAVSGPGRWAPRPVRQALIVLRNREALRRLGYLAEGRYRPAAPLAAAAEPHVGTGHL